MITAFQLRITLSIKLTFFTDHSEWFGANIITAQKAKFTFLGSSALFSKLKKRYRTLLSSAFQT